MKKLLALAIMILFGSLFIYSQVPQAMTYKAIAKDDWGIALPNKAITLRFTIIQGSEYGPTIYREKHNTTTSKFGLMDVKIGTGISDIGAFADIDWSTGVYYIRIEMDPRGGNDFRLEDSPHQLLSVPYALYAGSAANTNFSETDPVFTGHPAFFIMNGDIVNWNTAFNWGDHSLQGYLTTENDPAVEQNFDFDGAVEGDLLQYNGTKWVKVTPNYIISESDPLFAAWDKSTDISITESQITDLNHFTNADETDPIYTATFSITDPQDGDLLRFNAATEKWEVYTPNYAAGNHIHDEATAAMAGFMSPDDKTKLDGLNNADGSETKINAGANVTITGEGTEATPYVISSAGGTGALTLSQVLDYGNDAGSKNITNIADPVNAQDAATKAYTTLKVSATGDSLFLGTNQWVIIPGISAANPSISNTFIDTRDGYQYKTVTIGTQIWMAENLKYLPDVVGPVTYSNTAPYHYVYGYNGTSVSEAKATDNYQTYGVLYNWPAAMAGSASSVSNPSGVQGVCPAGWHLPSDAEWTELENYLIANGYNYDGTTTENKIAKSLASTNGWTSSTTIGVVGNADYSEKRNATGFSALPGGCREPGDRFVTSGSFGYWWSATESSSNTARSRYLCYSRSDLYRWLGFKEYGFSVRCLKDY